MSVFNRQTKGKKEKSVYAKQMELWREQAKNRIRQNEWYEEQKNDGLIYLIQNTKTGERYVGSTRNSLGKRWGQHLSQAAEGNISRLCDNIREYGKESFEKSVLYECKSYDDIEIEKGEWIDRLAPELNS